MSYFGKVKSRIAKSYARKGKPGNFQDLYERERGTLGDQSIAQPSIRGGLPDQEPRVLFAPEDRVGLALSGGGIRSATFNLGLLQGLEGLGLLQQVDYLSTVSGGGYIGGWYSAWRYRCQNKGQISLIPSDADQAEVPEIRHIRDFGKFLSPRVSVLEVTLWYGIVTILCGLLVGLASAASLITSVFLAWISITRCLWAGGDLLSFMVFFVATLGWLVGLERWWLKDKRDEDLQSQPQSGSAEVLKYWAPDTVQPVGSFRWSKCIVAPAILFVLPILAATISWYYLKEFRYFDDFVKVQQWESTAFLRDILGWDSHVSIFGPALAWATAALLLIILRFLTSRVPNEGDRSSVRSTCERSASRLIGLSLLWLIILSLWLAGAYIEHFGVRTVVGLFTASSGAFALMRNWLTQNLTKPRTASAPSWLRQRIPQLLGYLIVTLGAILVARLIIVSYHDYLLWLVCVPFLIILLVLVFFDPTVMGLHAFYRDRIARAYLGEPTLQVDPQQSDDFDLSEIPTGKPIHLVCTTVNGLADDPLGSLGRCARSAVLSRHGISIGNCWRERKGISLGSALTASAAAFNSNMGSVSSRLGPAVTFTMAALNLRLGLWVSHPFSSTDSPYLPGLLYFFEMFGRTSSQMELAAPNSQSARAFIHLSDGAHFENLALYELVRRHCRYIIVSDCGADPEVKFDDLGNAARRVREDFGVDIEIDLEPLKPNSLGISKRHMAVGTIHYDRENDKGVLLYFKSSLTGDEPADVTQYKSRNDHFPHETTGDQFYDEAQWESYRRLGEHSAWAALGFIQRMQQPITARRVFPRARMEWYPSPPSLEANANAMAQRYVNLEANIRQHASAAFLCEVFGELTSFAPPPAGQSPLDPENAAATLSLLLEMTQFMEDVVQSCFLTSHSCHPLNVGWINLFQRWIYAPSFRSLWPVLRPLFGLDLRYFVEERLRFSAITQDGTNIEVVQLAGVESPGLALSAWLQLGRRRDGQQLFGGDLRLNDRNSPHTLQIGVLAADLAQGAMKWKSGDFFMTPGLWGAGLEIDFLDALVEKCRGLQTPITKFVVMLEDLSHSDRAKRDLRTDLVDFYSAAGFGFTSNNNEMVRT